MEERADRRVRALLRPLAVTAALAAYLLFVRPRLLRWGATPEEAGEALPGDELVPRPHVVATRAVTVDAPPEAVWPWLAQMGGPPRAGWYGYDPRDEPGRIVPELQKIEVGDLLPTGRGGTGYRVVEVEPERLLVLSIHAFHVLVSWTITLREAGGRTRVVFRQRVQCRPGVLGLVYLLLSQSADFLTVRKQLTTIKALAEREFRRSFVEP
ncbi:SRPBCC family protein [Actinomadura sp. ATCC 31491]|uniref:SRPBCC family protein n=1 Tax=Actinomadura luzonensis TaxID=2805427 RepID=A0ABT0FY98_9ACTN|nr:SRPBCC family protein [Actinomadura luzonensis]MCK2217331.1 SRPBCC family protein [Actinomadura luzonensis]